MERPSVTIGGGSEPYISDYYSGKTICENHPDVKIYGAPDVEFSIKNAKGKTFTILGRDFKVLFDERPLFFTVIGSGISIDFTDDK